MSRERGGEAGVVLINVLVMLALSATVVYAMLSLSELSLARSQRFSEAGQALALVRAGELSAIAALRRAVQDAEPGGASPELSIAQEPVEIAGGSFALVIEDAQGRYNLNGLARGGLLGLETLRALAAALGLPPDTAPRIAASLALHGPLETLEALVSRAGLAPEHLAALEPYVTALPGPADVNINAAPVELLAVLLGNPTQARLLVSIRERRGALTPADLETARVVLPPGAGYRSDHFRLLTTVRIGGTVQTVESLLQRRRGTDGGTEVAVVRRKNAAAAMLPPPPSRLAR